MPHAATPLGDLLAPYETRPVTLPRDTIAERQRGLAFGAELSRLQGGIQTPARRRLMKLHACGQVTREEFIDLSETIARLGLHEAELGADGR